MKTNWQIKKIDEVCILRPQKSEIKLTKDDLVSFVPMEDMKVFSKDLNLHTDRKLSEVRDGYTYFANEDVLLAKITPCFENGKLGIARGLKNGIGFGSSEYFVFRSKGEILPDYLYYILSSDNFRDQGIKLMSGAVGHKRVPKEYVENFKISFPPIPEQKRIVKILDEAFEKLEKAKENTEKNLQNSKELFESYLNDIFSNPKKDWEEKTLGDICVFENGDRGKNYPAKSKLHLEGIPFVTAGNIDNHDIVLGGKNYLSEKQYDLLSRGKFSRGDILFCLRGSLGKFAVVNSIEYGAIASSLMIVKPNKEVISNFLYYYFQSNLCMNMIKKYKGGAAQPNLGAKDVKKFDICIPSLIEQESIIKKLDQLSDKTKKLESLYQQKLENIEELKKSILQKAFGGEL